MEISLQQLGESSGAGVISVAEQVFGVEYKPALIHQVVTAYLSAGRSGTRAQKNRSAVSGGGAKPWRQKGTGRARAGTSRSPIWRGGGVTFAAVPKDYSQKLNKKMYRGAIRSILSELLRQERLVVIDSLNIDQPKTKLLLEKLSTVFSEIKRVLIVSAEIEPNLMLSARNIHEIGVLSAGEVDPVSLVGAEKVLITTAALKKLEESLA